MDQAAWVVMKFGGTSVASVDRWATIMAQAMARLDAGERPVVVCSAISGVSDAIEDILRGCASGHPETALTALRAKHQDLADALGVDLDREIGEDLSEIDDQVRGASLIREVTPRLHARLMAMGERMSTRLGAAFLRRSGVAVTWIDARDHLRATDASNVPVARAMLNAECDFGPDRELQAAFASCEHTYAAPMRPHQAEGGLGIEELPKSDPTQIRIQKTIALSHSSQNMVTKEFAGPTTVGPGRVRLTHKRPVCTQSQTVAHTHAALRAPTYTIERNKRDTLGHTYQTHKQTASSGNLSNCC